MKRAWGSPNDPMASGPGGAPCLWCCCCIQEEDKIIPKQDLTEI